MKNIFNKQKKNLKRQFFLVKLNIPVTIKTVLSV